VTTSKIWVAEGTVKTFKDSGGDVAFTLTALANNAGRVSAQLDLGAAPRPVLHRLSVSAGFAAALAYGAMLHVYIIGSDGTTHDGEVLGTADAAVTALSKFNNATPVGSVVADGQTDNDRQNKSFIVPIYHRYVQVGLWNSMGQAFEAVGTYASYVTLISLSPDIQAAA